MASNRQLNPTIWVALLLLARLIVGGFLIALVLPVSIDDYFRLYHAVWWWAHPSFSSSFVWLPGHQYIYGPLIALFDDAVLVPRIFSLALHLLTGLFVASSGKGNFVARMLAAALVLFGPLSFFSGTTPLTESLLCFYLSLYWFFATRFIQSQRVFLLLGSAVALLLSSTVRYETWLLLPVHVYFVRNVSAIDATKFICWSVLLLPFIFPVAWIFHGAANPEGIFAFLWGTREDHLGPGSVWDLVNSFPGVVSLGIWVGTGGYMVWKRREMNGLSTKITIALFVLLSCQLLFLAGDNLLPSQFTVRMYTGPLLSVSLFLTTRTVILRRLQSLCMVAVLLFTAAASFIVAVRQPIGMDAVDFRTGNWVHQQFEDGLISTEDHVLVSLYRPQSAAILIFGNQLRNIHIDEARPGCVAGLLSPYDSMCEASVWATDVKIIVVRKEQPEMDYVRTMAWEKVYENEGWEAWRRTAGKVFPETGKPPHPLVWEMMKYREKRGQKSHD